jgi:hypothetical protein
MKVKPGTGIGYETIVQLSILEPGVAPNTTMPLPSSKSEKAATQSRLNF